MAFISISITKNHPLILGKGGFGRQLADWLSAEGWGEAEFLDDNAPGCVGGLRDYADPKLLKPGRPAFVALGDNALRVELLQKLAELAGDAGVHGLLVQLPLPAHIDEKTVIEAIPPQKDVDGFTAVNVGRMMIGEECFLPCTPAGCMEMIRSTGVSISGKNAVVIGRSNIVGKPAAMLLLRENATVTICHSRTENLKQVCANADILVAAVGRAGFVTGDMVKPGAVVIDVGINRNAQGKLCGDVDYDAAAEKAGYITPVPGGVGLMTRAMLMQNTLQAAQKQALAK